MRISDWSSDVCSSDLLHFLGRERGATLPGAVDHELQFVRFRRRGRGLLLRHFLRGLVLAGLRRGHRFASPSMRDSSASRRASRLSWSNAVLSGSLMRNTSSARSPKVRSEEHTSELQSLMRISYAVFCLKKKKKPNTKK